MGKSYREIWARAAKATRHMYFSLEKNKTYILGSICKLGVPIIGLSKPDTSTIIYYHIKQINSKVW